MVNGGNDPNDKEFQEKVVAHLIEQGLTLVAPWEDADRFARELSFEYLSVPLPTFVALYFERMNFKRYDYDGGESEVLQDFFMASKLFETRYHGVIDCAKGAQPLFITDRKGKH